MELKYKVENENLTINQILQNNLKVSSRLLYKLVKNNCIFLNGKECDTRNIASPNDIITINLDYSEDNSNIVPTEMNLNIELPKYKNKNPSKFTKLDQWMCIFTQNEGGIMLAKKENKEIERERHNSIVMAEKNIEPENIVLTRYDIERILQILFLLNIVMLN